MSGAIWTPVLAVLAGTRDDRHDAPAILHRQIPALPEVTRHGPALWLRRRPSRATTVAVETMAMLHPDATHPSISQH